MASSDEERANALLIRAKQNPNTIRNDITESGELLRSSDPEIRKKVTMAVALVAKKHPDVVGRLLEELIDCLEDDTPTVRNNAAVSVTQLVLQNPAATKPALGALVECVAEERGGHAQAALAIKGIVDEHPDALRSYSQRLATALESDDSTIRERVAMILAEVAKTDPNTVSPAIGALADCLDKDNADIREHAALTLARVAREHPGTLTNLVGPLARHLSDEPRIRNPVLEALNRIAIHDAGKLRPVVQEFKPLLASDETATRRGAVTALLKVAEEQPSAVRPVLPNVEPLLVDQDDQTRANALGIFGYSATATPEEVTSVASRVIDSLDHNHERVRLGATTFLGHVAQEEPEAVRSGFDALVTRLDDDKASVRSTAAKAIETIAEEFPATAQAAANPLTTQLDVSDPEVREHTIKALRQAVMDDSDWIDPAHVRRLEPLLDDDNAAVRGEAAMTMAVFAMQVPDYVSEERVRQLPSLFREEAKMSADLFETTVSNLESATGLRLTNAENESKRGGARRQDGQATGTEPAVVDQSTEGSPVRPRSVKQDGIVVEKEVDRDEFSAPAIRLLVANRRGYRTRVRIVEEPPDEVSVSEIRLPPEYHANAWTVRDQHSVMEFEHAIDPGDTVETVYVVETGAGDAAGFDGRLVAPTVEVADVDGGDFDPGTPERVPPQPAVPAADVEGVEPPPERDLTDVAGMAEVKERLQEEVLIPAMDERYEAYGVGGVTNIMLHGPPGTGKTYLAKALAGHLGYNYLKATASDIASEVVGQAPSNVTELFDRARAAAPCLLFIDEIDSVAVNRGGPGKMTTSEQQMVTELLNEIEALNDADEEILLVAATNRIEAVDDAIERPGRFDARIAVRKPSGEGRFVILKYHLESMPVAWDEIDKQAVVTATEGFAASHMAKVADAAGRNAVRDTRDSGDEPTVTADHLHEAIEDLQDQRKAEATEQTFLRDPPDIDFDDVVGLGDVKRRLREKIIDPLENPEMFRKLNLSIDRGVLLYGPPGTGKTYLAQALAGELDIDYVQASTSDIVSKYIGEAAKNVREMFDEARTHQPCLVFIDELDALATDRAADQTRSERQMVNEFLDALSEIEDADDDVIVVGATNRPEDIDPAIKRSGRLNEHIEIPPPGRETREALFSTYLNTDTVVVDEDWLGRETAGLVASDIKRLAMEATRAALNRHRRERGSLDDVDVDDVRITQQDIEGILEEIRDEDLTGTG